MLGLPEHYGSGPESVPLLTLTHHDGHAGTLCEEPSLFPHDSLELIDLAETQPV